MGIWHQFQSVPTNLKTQQRDLEVIKLPSDDMIYDIAVLGSGPAGLSAALFGARAGLNVKVLGSATGLLSETTVLDNFPSFPSNKGVAWLDATRRQAIEWGAEFATPGVLAQKVNIVVDDSKRKVFDIQTTEGAIYAWSTIIATGATPRRLDLRQEEVLWGKSLHSCAICDGHLYANETVLVIGGGDSAIDAAHLLARQAQKVILIHRRSEFSAKNTAAVDHVRNTSNIEIVQPYAAIEWVVSAQNEFIGARLRNMQSDKEIEVKASGAFVMIGATPNTAFVKGFVEMDRDGFIAVKPNTRAASADGIFTAGEVSDPTYKQAITAASEGAQAAIDSERWLRTTTGIVTRTRKRNSSSTTTAKSENVLSSKPMETKRVDQHGINCDLNQQNCIRSIVDANAVVVFSKTWCPYCRRALEALAAAGVQNPFVIDLTHQPPTIQATLKEMTGRRTVPNVFIGGRSIGGGDETVALQSKGELVPLLQAAGAVQQGDNSTVDEEKESCDLSEESCIKGIIQKYPVVMFSLEWCPECKRTLEYLSSLGATRPHIIDLDEYKTISNTIRQHMVTLSGRRSVPNLFVGAEHFGGFLQTKSHETELLSAFKKVQWPLSKQQ